MFSFVVAELRGAMAQFLPIAAPLGSFHFSNYLLRRFQKFAGYYKTLFLYVVL